MRHGDHADLELRLVSQGEVQAHDPHPIQKKNNGDEKAKVASRKFWDDLRDALDRQMPISHKLKKHPYYALYICIGILFGVSIFIQKFEGNIASIDPTSAIFSIYGLALLGSTLCVIYTNDSEAHIMHFIENIQKTLLQETTGQDEHLKRAEKRDMIQLLEDSGLMDKFNEYTDENLKSALTLQNELAEYCRKKGDDAVAPLYVFYGKSCAQWDDMIITNFKKRVWSYKRGSMP